MKPEDLRTSAGMLVAPCLVLVIIFLANNIAYPQMTAQHKLGIKSGNSLISNKEQFEFTLDGNEKVVLNSANPIVYFSKLFASGQSYRITQTSGPRPCTYLDSVAGTFANADVSVIVNCGYPPLTIMRLQITGIEAGETFGFTDNYRRTMSAPFSVTASLGGFPQGDDYSVSQTSGPRPCRMTLNQGVVPNTPLTIAADCRKTGDTDMPTSIFRINVTGVEMGDTFVFSTNNGRNFSTPFSTTALLGSFPVGSNYSVTQSAGPRPCKMSLNQGVVPNTPVTIGADCRKASAESPGPTRTFPEIELVSRSTDDKSFGTFYSASAPVIGGTGADEGRYIAYVSDAAGLGGSKGRFRQLFWRDRVTNETRMISATTAGEGNGNSFAPSISADGQSVAFESYAPNLVPIDTNNVRDIFVWNAKTNTVTAVSTGPGEIETNAESFDPVISGDGSLVAFSSGASNLAPGVTGIDTINVYLKKVGSGMGPVLISADPKAKKGVGGSKPSISDDGSKVAFYSFASSLVSDDKNGMWDIFLYDAQNPKLKRLTLTASGAERDQGTDSISRVVAPSISGDGNFVAFSTTATNVVAGDNNKLQDVFVVNVGSGEIKRVSTGANGIEGDGESPAEQGEKIGISFDGSLVAYSTSATNLGGNIILKDVTTGEITVISADVSSRVSRPSVSRNGWYVIFGSGSRLDSRFLSSGIFTRATGLTRCRSCVKDPVHP